MRASSIVLFFTSAFTAFAAPHERRQTTQSVNQSAPFHLRLTSRNATYNGSLLFAGHAGAAIESFLLTKNASTASPFYFNTTSNGGSVSNVTGATGILGWDLIGGNFVAPSSARFVYDPSTNSAPIQLYPESTGATQFAFDKKNQLNVPYYNAANSSVEALKRWYICKQYTSGYQYVSLAWGLGPIKPENPSCVAVTVTRVFI